MCVCFFFLLVSASFFGDIQSHERQYLTRGNHRGNIRGRPMGLCAFVCGHECWGADTLCPVGGTDTADTPRTCPPAETLLT